MVKTRVFVAIILVVLVVAVVLTVVFFTRKTEGTTARVYVDGELVYSVDLSSVDEPYEKIIETPYGTNILKIEQGRICVSDADCPDQVCVETGWLENGSVPIVCLPHKLVIKIEKNGEVDAVAE